MCFDEKAITIPAGKTNNYHRGRQERGKEEKNTGDKEEQIETQVWMLNDNRESPQNHHNVRVEPGIETRERVKGFQRRFNKNFSQKANFRLSFSRSSEMTF